MQLTLYTRPECHLCEQALSVAREVGVEPDVVDISGDVALLTAYGDRIPVLKRQDTGDELGWPFSSSRLRSWLGLGQAFASRS